MVEILTFTDDENEASAETATWSPKWLNHLHELIAEADITHNHTRVQSPREGALGSGESLEEAHEKVISDALAHDAAGSTWVDYGIMGARVVMNFNYGHVMLHTILPHFEAFWERGMEGLFMPEEGKGGGQGRVGRTAEPNVTASEEAASPLPFFIPIDGVARGEVRKQCRKVRMSGAYQCGSTYPEVAADIVNSLFHVVDPFAKRYPQRLQDTPARCFRRLLLAPASRHMLDMKQLASSSADKKLMYGA